MLAFANAKINLGLNVIEKRPDGYHNLETVFYPVKIYDTIEITDAENTFCEIRGVAIPGDSKDNLCLQAYHLMKKDFDLPPQQITLLKNIPVGAGLGGGSADAAFLIKLLNTKFELGLSVIAMEDYARVLGADCAFFIENTPAYATDRGDRFVPATIDLSAYFMVLVKPPVHVSTADAFGGLKPARPALNVLEVLSMPVNSWKETMKNDFEETIFNKYPEIAAVKTDLYHAGATFALMSGSGSSVFAIFDSAVTLPELEKTNRVFYNI
ncbi:4-(cytidine 5'-diphospho)-2-C-methyl-D-erythritol kinase [Pedobacter sp. MC2016-15]|uniref:4-(cytidine 5'-diphospho)-2-C-methyl-D-erythritol kinase n=1 Tax=Pedobacter sp. MC2016-15 TaxID=2994473 RepID=UPI002246CF1E|nr:4-(cytidine 5'-diphospho)-2-C-methyl-D-erythritol kinase [Pedobacter sp. MC2016-15]MCX2480146.1 4-(cytidine 5'-diphospho)-2-C-methyl-D-erythritol kinase [Pedobacter sp. MC2016-15]